MILVDSSVWIDFFNGLETRQTDALDDLLGQEPVLIGDLILTDVLQGFRRDADYRKARALLDTLELRQLGGKRSLSRRQTIIGVCAAVALHQERQSI